MSDTPLYDIVKQWFQSDEWPITELEGRTVLRSAFKGDNGQWSCFAQTREDRFQFIFYSTLQTNVPEPKRPVMADFLTRANYGLIIGNFEMDFSDGEVRYKTSIDVENDRLTPALIKTMVYANVSIMDRYLPGVMALMYNDSTTAEAEIHKIEG